MGRKICICGATGKQGRAVINSLFERNNYDIVGLVRRPESLAAVALTKRGVTIVKGDLGDPASLLNAFQGVYGVYLMTVSASYGKDAAQAETQQGINAIDAAKETGVEFFVFSSACGPKAPTGISFYDAKLPVEVHLHASGLKCFIVKPTSFMDNIDMPGSEPKQGILPGLFDPGYKLNLVAIEDIGKMVAIAFDRPDEFAGKDVELSGDFLSGAEMAAVCSKVRGGEPWRYSQVPTWILQFVVPDVAKMVRHFQNHPYYVDVVASRAVLPEMLTWEQFLEKRGFATQTFPKPSGCVLS